MLSPWIELRVSPAMVKPADGKTTSRGADCLGDGVVQLHIGHRVGRGAHVVGGQARDVDVQVLQARDDDVANRAAC